LLENNQLEGFKSALFHFLEMNGKDLEIRILRIGHLSFDFVYEDHYIDYFSLVITIPPLDYIEILDNINDIELNILNGSKIFLKGIEKSSLQCVSICSDLTGTIITNNISIKEDLTSRVHLLKNLLTNVATGGDEDNAVYVELRSELLNNEDLSNIMPKWLKPNRDIKIFWDFIKSEFSSYAERRNFITNEFNPVLDYLEFDYSNKNIKLSKSQEHIKESESKEHKIKNKVFIVHGRDNEVKQEVSRFIESLGLVAIILHEQASSGMTIIEKIEHYSNEADFAIILYTPCDLGRGSHESKSPARNRARQNVVFEHGYLMAKLGRENICPLVKGYIETPNDISGVVYVDLDTPGAWKLEVIKELKVCGYTIKYT